MGDIMDFVKPATTVEVIKDQLEDDNIKTLIACIVGEDNDMYILDSGDADMTLEEVSFFAHYFDTLRRNILDDMLFDAEPIEV